MLLERKQSLSMFPSINKNSTKRSTLVSFVNWKRSSAESTFLSVLTEPSCQSHQETARIIWSKKDQFLGLWHPSTITFCQIWFSQQKSSAKELEFPLMENDWSNVILKRPNNSTLNTKSIPLPVCTSNSQERMLLLNSQSGLCKNWIIHLWIYFFLFNLT